MILVGAQSVIIAERQALWTVVGPDSKLSQAKVTIALGGGRAGGIAQVLALEALDEMGISLVAIAGTFMGAIVGGAYAAGIKGAPFGIIYCES